MTTDDALSRVYESLIQNCEPYAIEGPLSFLAAAPGAFRNPRDPATTIANLTAEYTLEALLQAGVVDRGSDGTLGLAQSLADPIGILIALRESASGRISDLMTDRGCLSGRELPIFAILHDGPTRAAGRTRGGELLVAFSTRDVAVLRACGLAATLATGLQNLNPSQCKQLARTSVWRCARVIVTRKRSSRLARPRQISRRQL